MEIQVNRLAKFSLGKLVDMPNFDWKVIGLDKFGLRKSVDLQNLD